MARFVIKRIYDPPTPADGFRVLVDRVWPRGVLKDGAAIDLWAKEIAPSAELRKWFGHDPAKWEGFRARYRAELAARSDALGDLLARCGDGTVTLLYGARDREHNQAVVLKEVLEDVLGARPADRLG